MNSYIFDPTQYGFLPSDQLPLSIADHFHKKCFFKVIAFHLGSFWYLSCNKKFEHEDEWEFTAGLINTTKQQQISSSTKYRGCITSKEYAELLLIHLLGTSKNEGTLKAGFERLKSESLPIS